jgi:hypothetical protein
MGWRSIACLALVLVVFAARAEPDSGGNRANAPAGLVARFERYRAASADLTPAGLLKQFGPAPAPSKGPGFDVRKAKYFDLVTKTLQMTPDEEQLLTRGGVVSVDHRQPFTMGSAYYAIYTHDLPVLITTDSILHALHRSYDVLLEELEEGLFTDAIAAVLADTHARLATAAGEASAPAESLRDVDLYLTVARNLLAGAVAPPDETGDKPAAFLPSRLGQDREARVLLDRVRALAPARTEWMGSARDIDYTQFRPRGHYALTAELRRYFRAMMWLGRPDTGFSLGEARGLRAAATLSLLLQQAGAAPRLAAMGRMVDFLVGSSDDGTILELAPMLTRAGIDTFAGLAEPPRLAALDSDVRQSFADRGLINGQLDRTSATGPVAQLFGQRFGIDSFVLSKVVYDTILFRGEQPQRTMPTGLDVAAALGNVEAVRQLGPELDRWHYAANLAAVHRIVSEQTPDEWDASAYGMWLNALRTLDDVPAGTSFPRVMRTTAWQRKQLQTQLASWAELRHDTILYLKQSYTSAICSYPGAYVEPYPAFFARVGELATVLASRLRDAELPLVDEKRRKTLENSRAGEVRFFEQLAGHMSTLEGLARKELAAQPFTKQEIDWVKSAVRSHRGCKPTFDGWYASLFLGGQPLKRTPTIADVHTDPNSEQVLEEAVGDATFVVVAIDNRRDRAVYVGPAYSYYELTAPMKGRMTDQEWEARIDRPDLPARPAWTDAFQGAPLQRSMEQPDAPPHSR